MKLLVQFELTIPDTVARSEVESRERAESAATQTLADQGHLVRVWRASLDSGQTTILGLYRAESRAELNGLLAALPLSKCMDTLITSLVPHPNDPTRLEQPQT